MGMFGVRGISRLVASRAGSSVVVVMMHRFTASAGGHAGHDPLVLKRTLSELRRAGVAMVDVEEALEQLDGNAHPTGASLRDRPQVAFTIDDGYADALEVAGPIFAEFDCPVTCFVAPDIVDGKDWYWWDKLDTVLRACSRVAIEIEFQGVRRRLSLKHAVDTQRTFDELCEWIKQLPADALPAFLAQVALATEIEIPAVAPSQYRVLQWSEMRAAEQRGWRFGAHSMTHPIMQRCTDSRAEWEIAASVAAVKSQLMNASGVFCYPVGRQGDFGSREFEILGRLGVRWALSATPGMLHGPIDDSTDSLWRLRVPRFAHDERPGGVMRMFLN